MFYLFAALLLINFKPWEDKVIEFYVYQGAKVLGMVGYIFIITYLGLVDQTFTAFISHVGWIIAIIWIAEYVWTVFEEDTNLFGLIKLIAGVIASLWFAYIVLIHPISIAQEKHDVVNAKEVTTVLPQTDEQKIVSVPKQYAKYKAEKLVGELENYSYYNLGSYSIQEIDGNLTYVIPVEFSEYSTWKRAKKKTPGYITVDALDENKPAKLVKSEMRYVPSAYFGDNLERMVRKKYPDIVMFETSFEPNDEGKPYYVVTYGYYENFRSIPKVEGIILFDPSNGKMKRYKTKDIPDFIDQIVPPDVIATNYNEWFGKYGQGWLNSWWGKKDIKVPTTWGLHADVSPVYDANGNMHWFSDFTTLNTDASSMVGYSMIDARTGAFTYFKGENANGLANATAATKAVDKSFTKDKWEGVQPMLYNIYGEMTWFVPVVDGDGLLRSYALVNAKDPKVLATGETKQKAFQSYKTLLVTKLNGENVQPGQGMDMEKRTGVIVSKEVVTKGEDIIIFLQIDTDEKKLYQASMSKNPFAVVLEKGQTIEVEYMDTEEAIVELQSIAKVQP